MTTHRESSSEWLSEPRAAKRQLRKQVRGTLLSSGIGDPLVPPIPLALQNLGRATLAEAKFTFLYGAWGGVQNMGPSELRTVVVMGPPEPVLRCAVLRAGGHS